MKCRLSVFFTRGQHRQSVHTLGRLEKYTSRKNLVQSKQTFVWHLSPSSFGPDWSLCDLCAVTLFILWHPLSVWARGCWDGWACLNDPLDPSRTVISWHFTEDYHCFKLNLRRRQLRSNRRECCHLQERVAAAFFSWQKPNGQFMASVHSQWCVWACQKAWSDFFSIVPVPPTGNQIAIKQIQLSFLQDNKESSKRLPRSKPGRPLIFTVKHFPHLLQLMKCLIITCWVRSGWTTEKKFI